ncbi:MAG: hypothetical protein K0S53_2952 [Bacteroidetes bacterium]|nr:hypothetical protein [Bacteroidota bacterium]MDF2452542.1 hypothetical protein [Bacteroidota bacterium]
MKRLLLTIACAFSLNSYSQNQTIQWQNIIAGEEMEHPGKMIQSTTGSYFSVGATSSTIGDLAPYKGFYDAWIVKIDANGNFEWKKNFGGSNVDILTDIIQTNDGNYIAVGHSGSSDGDLSTNTYSADPRGALLIKFDDAGTILWQKRVGGGNELNTRVIESPNGELNVFANSTSNGLDILSHYGTSSTSDIVYFRLTSTGTVIEQKTYGGSEDEYLTSVSATNDGGFVVLANSSSSDYDISQHVGTHTMNAWVFKIDSNKSLVWDKSYMINGLGKPNNILALSNGHVIFSFLDNEGMGNLYTDGIVTLLNAQGNLVWQKSMGGAKHDNINDFIEVAPNHIALLGSTSSNDSIVVNDIPGEPVWLLEIDSLGTINWQNTYGGTMGETAANFVKTSDGGFAISANTRSHDFDVINPNYWNCMCTDAWLFKLSPLSVGITENKQTDLFSLYPNPAHDFIHVNASQTLQNESYVLVNTLGQTVLSGKLEGQDHTIDIQTLTPGFYSLQVGVNKQSYKIIKE